MNDFRRLFSDGDLGNHLNTKLHNIRDAVSRWDEDLLLKTPYDDVFESMTEQFLIDAPALNRGGITMESVAEGHTTAWQFGEEVHIPGTVVTILVPYTGNAEIFTLRPNTFTYSPPNGGITPTYLRLRRSGPRGQAPEAVRDAIDEQLDEIDRWLTWGSGDIHRYNERAATTIRERVQDRKRALLDNRNLEASLGFPVRKRPDAVTYAVPLSRRRIAPKRTSSAPGPFRPEPALADADYEEALRILRNQRNGLERSPSTTAKMDEENIRDMLLMGLNSHFEGAAAGGVFNGRGKTDILIRVEDRHIFIGECKIWRGPKTITDTLDQLLGYLVWRDTKAALLLFIRAGAPSEIIPKALNKFREHPNFKRDGQHEDFGERHDFIFHTNGDTVREIKLAFLPFALPN